MHPPNHKAGKWCKWSPGSTCNTNPFKNRTAWYHMVLYPSDCSKTCCWRNPPCKGDCLKAYVSKSHQKISQNQSRYFWLISKKKCPKIDIQEIVQFNHTVPCFYIQKLSFDAMENANGFKLQVQGATFCAMPLGLIDFRMDFVCVPQYFFVSISNL